MTVALFAPETAMRYGSVCSGVEAASVAWRPLGWNLAWLSEVDPFARAVLAARHPDTPNHGDMRGIGREHGPIDVLVGGTPCQSFSVNGLRAGLADDRGDLTLHYVRLLGLLRPRWFVWENVPGALSADAGRAFGTFLGLLEERGYGYAWRVLDARHFGVPQRRRRLFVVGHSGGRCTLPVAALFDARGGAGDAVTPLAVRQDRSAVGARRDPAVVVGWTGDPTPKFGLGVSPTLRASQGGEGVCFAAAGRSTRFTPREWERLMGFPDDYTLIPFGGKLASDKQRTTALGNSFPVPVLHWLGQRIDHLEKIDHERQNS